MSEAAAVLALAREWKGGVTEDTLAFVLGAGRYSAAVDKLVRSGMLALGPMRKGQRTWRIVAPSPPKAEAPKRDAKRRGRPSKPKPEMAGPSMDELMAQHDAIVQHIAAQIAQRTPPDVGMDALLSAGREGLWAALRRFDGRPGVKFSTYAHWRVKGAILDYLRTIDWIPASLRQKAKAEGDDGRYTPLSLDEEMDSEDGSYTLADLLPSPYGRDPLDVVIAKEQSGLLWAAVRRLPGRERAVVVRVWRAEERPKAIAESMRVSVSRVSQLKTRALNRLRADEAMQAV